MKHTPMEKWILFFLTLLNLQAFIHGQPESWIGIDCGSNKTTTVFGILWQTDEAFIKTGTNHLIPEDSNLALTILNTLRVFTEQNKICYTLPAYNSTRYFIRAVFFYANYDGLSNPPTFDLQIDGNKLVTVVTSLTEIKYYEILYQTQNTNISVCLARTQNNQFPFISSLESWPILSTMYTSMNQDLAWLNSYRYDYGSDSGIIGYSSNDNYNRIWEPISAPGVVNTSADPGTTIISSPVEDPPVPAILDAIEAQDETTSLFLSFGPMRTVTTIYFEAYFTEMQLLSTGTRSFDMYVDGKSVRGLDVITVDYGICSGARVLVQTTSSNLTIELRPTQTTKKPPTISAIEIYTASDPLITTWTNQNDVNGVEILTSTFDRLKGWSGEPCLPADTVWQWLGCTGTDPPRVTSLNLSGYGLNGTLPNFNQMQALEEIDLSSNSLSGEIPSFLGQLPNLKNLNLSYNEFSGALPSSIRDNRRLTYDITGNPMVHASSKNKATIIGLAVGIPLLVIVIILAVTYWLIRKRANESQNQATELETANGSAPQEPTAEEIDEDCVPVDEVGLKPDKQSMVPEMDLDELEELIDSHEKYEAEVALDEEDYVEVGEHGVIENDESMVPDMDMEELDEIIRNQNQRANELAGRRSDI